MAIPPFPSQEVAKLVLGYLAEEHLMTAYDEFLQASPYLDAFSNEYGRVFMTSLKNILAEYMAVKICVETCKPISLRKKLMQCTNLLEVVKLLIALVDVQKNNFQDNDKPRLYKQNVLSKVAKSCEICNSSDLVSCSCNANSYAKNQISCETEAITESSVETTSLADLPGNAVIQEHSPKNVSTSNYNVQRCELDPSEPSINQRLDKELINHIKLNQNSVTSYSPEKNTKNNVPLKSNMDVRTLLPPPLLTTKPDAAKKNIEEFNTILNIIAEQNANSKVPPSTAVSNTGTFQEFADGVKGKVKDKEYSSCIPEHPPDAMKYHKNANFKTNIEGTTKEMISAPLTGITHPNDEYATICTEEKNTEQKIKILSDIKVSNNTFTKIPPILKSTTPTPLVQMKTLYINGTPAYKNKLQIGTNYNYTKEEIMAMPTIILVPSSDSSRNPQVMVPLTTRATNKQHLDTTTSKSTTPRVLRPLSIDVETCNTAADKDMKSTELSLETIENRNERGLVKTVDVTTGSLPKETVTTSLQKTSTPTVLPPTKKSSSTPRRTSHIRVLDFTTPRRILNENSTDKNTIDPTNIPCTTHPNISCHDQVKERYERTNDENVYDNRIYHNSCQANMPLEIKIKPLKKSDWDADLRARLGQNDSKEPGISKTIKLKEVKPKGNKTDKKNILQSNDINKSKKKLKAKKSPKKRKEKSTHPSTKTKKKSEEITVEPNLEASVKSTINISGSVNSGTPSQENNNNQCQIDNVIEQSDTPEAERQALQNVIGAKLNISELLETPYKQALYDIQMETPRFLGPDLPGEPMSDIKIMNIPTPRFFGTPKITQATPSSYSSRQTDYSSGGSYYKPDDQDYIPIAEVLECAITVAEDSNRKRKDKEKSPEEVYEKSRRPVRKCAKNVSYRRSSGLSNKVKEDFKPKTTSLSSDVKSHSIPDKKSNKKVSPRKVKSELPSKCVVTKDVKISTLKIEAQKSVTKSIPRKTPLKEYAGKRNKKLSDSKHLFSIESQSKKKTTSVTSEIVAAPTKSRRKSATPRKLHCTKSFNSDSGEHNLTNLLKSKDVVKRTKVMCLQDSDSEPPPLRWSDDGSQEGKAKDAQEVSHSQNEEDDIDNIKKYIENCSKADGNKDGHNNLHFDTKRGFDAETAKIIERDLLDTPPRVAQSIAMDITNNEVKVVESSVHCQSQNSKPDNSCNEQGEDVEEEDEIEFSVCDCNEESNNYFSYIFDESKFVENNNLNKLKDKFCMELCMEEGISIRINATAISTMFEQDPGDFIVDENYIKETATAVSSISNIEKLYTPLKNTRNQCIEIFDSTLTSLDTPLKNDKSKEREPETPVTEIVLEIENIQHKDKMDTKKRKRSHSIVVDESVSNTKKLKSETQELLKSANIQNMDIESVLSKLHGP